MFPSYQTFGGGQTFQGNQRVTADQQRATQLSGAGTEQSPINQSLNQPVVTGGGTDVNQLKAIPGVKGGSSLQYQSGTFDPATAMTPGENALQGSYSPDTAYASPT